MRLLADRLNHLLATTTLRRCGTLAMRALVVAAIAAPAAVQPLLFSAQPVQAQSLRSSALPSVADLAEQVIEAVVNISAQTTTETRNRTMPNVPGLGPDKIGRAHV